MKQSKEFDQILNKDYNIIKVKKRLKNKNDEQQMEIVEESESDSSQEEPVENDKEMENKDIKVDQNLKEEKNMQELMKENKNEEGKNNNEKIVITAINNPNGIGNEMIAISPEKIEMVKSENKKIDKKFFEDAERNKKFPIFKEDKVEEVEDKNEIKEVPGLAKEDENFNINFFSAMNQLKQKVIDKEYLKMKKEERNKEEKEKQKKIFEKDEEEEDKSLSITEYQLAKEEDFQRIKKERLSAEDLKDIKSDIFRMVKEKGKVDYHRPQIDYLNPKFSKGLEEYTKELKLNKGTANFSQAYIPPSKAQINGQEFSFSGMFLDELTENYPIMQSFVMGLNDVGFLVPPSMVDAFKTFPPMTFTNMLQFAPEYFINFGPINGVLAVFSHPNSEDSTDLIEKKKVSMKQLKELTAKIPENFSDSKYISELLSIFYIEQAVPTMTIVSPNTNAINALYKEVDDKILKMIEANKIEMEKMLDNPQYYWSSKIKNVKVIDKEDKIVVLDEDQDIVKMSASQLAKVIKTRMIIKGPDRVMGYILSYMVPTKLNIDKIRNVIINKYVGTGSLSMVHERYNKSLKIYRESNSPMNVEFHKKFYDEEFYNMLEFFGYIYNGPKAKIPNDTVEYLAATSDQGYLLNRVNPHAHGTFTTFDRRNITGFSEIEAGLKNWKNITNDKSNPSFGFFFVGFKNICAKLKDEIHNLEKPPRFYNPTFIAAFIPFQYVLNKVFDQCPPFSEKCPYSLLGIKDIDHNFSDVMEEIYYSQDLRLHYSDNFWIKEGDQYVSVDVSRCDSNLSKEALRYPLITFGRMVLDDEDFEKYSIIVDIFISTIPRHAYFSTGNSKENVLLQLPFYWLPSGVVGTAYINHMFTGMFLYYTRDVKWINEKGELTKELLEHAQTFGIHLEIASYVDFSNINDGDCIPFDLLGRNGFYIQDTFVPALVEDRIWSSLLYMKKEKYDANPLISNFVRLQKIDTLISLGAMMYPDLREFVFTSLVSLSLLLRRNRINMTSEQSEKLREELDKFVISLDGYTKFIYKQFDPRITDYAYEKTGKYIKKEEWKKFDMKVAEKLNMIREVWASLLPVVRGVVLDKSIFTDNQDSPYPYFVANYIFDYLSKDTAQDKVYHLGRFFEDLMAIFGEKRGLQIGKAFFDIMRKESKSFTGKKLRKEMNDSGNRIIQYLIKKGEKPTEAKRKVKNLIDNILEDPDFYKKVSIDIYHTKKNEGKGIFEYDKSRVQFLSNDKILKNFWNIMKKVHLPNIYGRKNSDFWYMLKKGWVGKFLNYVMSQALFKGMTLKRMKEVHKGEGVHIVVNEYKDLPFIMDGKRIFDPNALKAHNDKMVIKGLLPESQDLGMLTGIITNTLNRIKED